MQIGGALFICAININYKNRSHWLDAITVLQSASWDRLDHFCLPLLSHGRHARKRRPQSRDKEVFQMQIGGALFICAININYKNRSHWLDAITVLQSASWDRLDHFCLPLLSHGRHARKRRPQSRDKEVSQMQIGGALFISKVYSRDQMFI